MAYSKADLESSVIENPPGTQSQVDNERMETQLNKKLGSP